MLFVFAIGGRDGKIAAIATASARAWLTSLLVFQTLVYSLFSWCLADAEGDSTFPGVS
jgi:hypothetical protein